MVPSHQPKTSQDLLFLSSRSRTTLSRLPASINPPRPHKPDERIAERTFILFKVGLDKMDDSERRTTKRSRFDQTEPEPKRASRFDRRSRSPSARRSEGRDRSPLGEDGAEAKKSPVDAAAAAGTSSNHCRRGPKGYSINVLGGRREVSQSRH